MRRWGNAGTETACERYQAVDGDKVAPETRTSDEVSEMPEEAPAATETRSGAKGKGKKGGSKQKKGD